ncbi:MAG: hypothetical protein PUF72_05405 [Clostridiales bacterium]|nr:hypothetical protein [Clostridiales bacterium]
MKFKKTVSLLMTAIMVVCIGTFNVYAETDNTQWDNAVGLLKTLEIVDDETPTNDNEIISRGVLAKEVYKLLNIKDAAYVNIFGDVTEETPYASYITSLAQMGIISKSDMYYPDDAAVYEQAVKMIVCLLGYDKAAMDGEWPNNYLNMANSIGLTENIAAAAGDKLTGRMLISLLYNSLGCEKLVYDDKNKYVTDSDRTLLTENFKTRKRKGIVTGNSQTYLALNGKTNEETIMLDDEYYLDPKGLVSGLLGYETYIYYQEADNEFEIIYAFKSERNSSKTIRAKDIDKANMTDLSKFAWYEGTKSRSKTMRLSKDMDVIYNGKSFPNFSIDTLIPDTGSVELVDNNADSMADVVFIWESKTYVFSSVNTDEKLIVDKYGKYFDYSKYDTVEFYDMYGQKTASDAMAAWNVLSIYESADGEYCKIVIYDDPVIGTVDRMYTDEYGTWIVVDDEEYVIAPEFEEAVEKGNSNAHEIVLGQTGIYYLNADEAVSASVIEDDWSSRYAYLVSVSLDENEETMYIKLFMNELQGFQTFKTKTKVKLDGQKISFDNAYRQLCAMEQQLIKIKLDGDSDIFEIDTASQGLNETSENMVCNAYRGTFYWSVRTGRLGTGETLSYLLDRYGESVETFVVPNTDVYNVDNYSKKADLRNNESYEVSIYDSNAVGIPKAAVVYQDSAAESDVFGNGDTDGGGMIVTDIKTVVNEDGDIVENIVGYRLFDGQAVNLYTNDKVDASRIKKGSLIDYYLDFKGRIKRVNVAIDPDNVNYNNTHRLYYYEGDTIGPFLANASRYVAATVMAKKDSGYIIIPESGMSIETLDPDNMNLQNSMIYSLGDAKIFLYKDKKVSEIKANELDSYVYSMNPKARVVVVATYSQLKGVVVYDNE